jgi:hypothetical protein
MCIAGLELFFRYHYRTRYTNAGMYCYDKNLGYKFKPNLNVFLGSKQVRFAINKYGYLGNNWDIKKSDSTFRIAIIGDCSVTGVMHIVDTCNYNFPDLIEKELKKKGYNVEILNFGMGGENHSYYLFKSISVDVIKFHPDLILFKWDLPLAYIDYIKDSYHGFEIEYLRDAPITKEIAIKWVDKINKFHSLSFFYNSSYLLKAIGKFYQFYFNNDLAKTLFTLKEIR